MVFILPCGKYSRNPKFDWFLAPFRVINAALKNGPRLPTATLLTLMSN
jgi:hypothetical protein